MIGNFEAGIRLLERSCALSKHLGNNMKYASTLGNIGIVYGKQGEHRAALEKFVEALSLVRDLGHRRSIGNLLGKIAAAHAMLGNTTEGLESNQEALAIARELGDAHAEAANLMVRGTLNARAGALPDARDDLTQAHRLFQTMFPSGHPQLVAVETQLRMLASK